MTDHRRLSGRLGCIACSRLKLPLQCEQAGLWRARTSDWFRPHLAASPLFTWKRRSSSTLFDKRTKIMKLTRLGPILHNQTSWWFEFGMVASKIRISKLVQPARMDPLCELQGQPSKLSFVKMLSGHRPGSAPVYGRKIELKFEQVYLVVLMKSVWWNRYAYR